MTTLYKSMILIFKLDEDTLQRWIYFLTFMESLEMKISQYNKTFELLLDDLKIRGEDMKNYIKNIYWESSACKPMCKFNRKVADDSV